MFNLLKWEIKIYFSIYKARFLSERFVTETKRECQFDMKYTKILQSQNFVKHENIQILFF